MDRNYLLSPISVGLFGLLLFFVILTFAPISPRVALNINTIIYFLFNYVMFFLGCVFLYLVPKKNKTRPQIYKHFSRNEVTRQFNLSLVLAILGIMLRLIDRFYYRNVSIFQSAMDNRALLAESNGGLISILGALIYPICFIVLYLFIKKEVQKKYLVLFWCTQITILGMLVSFPITGYALFSIIFSTLFLLCSYWFYVFFKRNNTCNKKKYSYKFITVVR